MYRCQATPISQKLTELRRINGSASVAKRNRRTVKPINELKPSIEDIKRQALNVEEGISFEEYSCPICYELLLEPLRLPQCHHVLCRSCCVKMLRNKPTSRTCPICRGEIPKTYDAENADIDNDLKANAQLYFPFESTKLSIQNKLEKRFKLPTLVVEYGNTHMHLKKGTKSTFSKRVLNESWNAFVTFYSSENRKK